MTKCTLPNRQLGTRVVLWELSTPFSILLNTSSSVISSKIPIYSECLLDENKFFAKFLHQTKSMDPMQRAKALEENSDIEEAHEAAASSGESKQPSVSDEK